MLEYLNSAILISAYKNISKDMNGLCLLTAQNIKSILFLFIKGTSALFRSNFEAFRIDVRPFGDDKELLFELIIPAS